MLLHGPSTDYIRYCYNLNYKCFTVTLVLPVSLVIVENQSGHLSCKEAQLFKYSIISFANYDIYSIVFIANKSIQNVIHLCSN